MLKIFNTRYFSTNIKNHVKLYKKINKLQKKIELIIENNNLDITIVKYKPSYSEKNLIFNEKKYIEEEKKIISETNKFLNI